MAQHLDFPTLRRREEAEEIVAWCETIWQEERGLRWGVTRRGDRTVIGTCGFHNWVHGDHRADVGYDLLPAYWGQGLMREALTAVLRHGFQVMELHRIQAMVDPRNNRSQRLLERLGFTREGVLREWRFYKGEFWDEICYALLEQDAGCAGVLRSQAR